MQRAGSREQREAHSDRQEAGSEEKERGTEPESHVRRQADREEEGVLAGGRADRKDDRCGRNTHSKQLKGRESST